MKNRTRIFAVIILSFAFATQAFADVEFIEPDISKTDQILFTAKVDVPGEDCYKTLFYADAKTGELNQLTYYPEQLTILENPKRLQVSNRFGVYITDINQKSDNFFNMKDINGIPSFVRGSSIQQGRLINNSIPSPDGNYILYLSPSSTPTNGNIILFKITNDKATEEAVIAENIEYSLSNFPAIWSKDSKYIIYEKSHKLFYYSIDQLQKKRVPDESWRQVFDGHISQCRWSDNGSLYVLRDTSMFRIMPEEFFTQAIYSGIVQPGILVGKTPFPYDNNFDTFWISPDGSKVLLCKDGRNLFLYELNPDDFAQEASVSAKPYLHLQGDTVINQVIWPKNNVITILTESFKDDKKQSYAYRIDMTQNSSDNLSSKFIKLDTENNFSSMVLSPNNKHVAIVFPQGITIKNYASWKDVAKFSRDNSLHSIWIDDNKLVTASKSLIEIIDIANFDKNKSINSSKIIALSQVEKYGWEEDFNNTIVVESASKAFKATIKDPQKTTNSSSNLLKWQSISSYIARPAKATSNNYRVYLDAIAAGSYKNIVMVRSAKELGTKSLLQSKQFPYKPFASTDDKLDKSYFNHGSRIRRREISLVINAYDSSEGLITVLDALKDYGINATFFVNGEFIRRNPGASKLIAKSGHEIGNMFFTNLDMTNSQFVVDKDFIKQGLARTEDEYFIATGSELSLLWHSPHYISNEEIIEAAKEMNYDFIGHDIDPLDWVGKNQNTKDKYLNTHKIIENVISKIKPGSIIPIRLGIPEGGRDDYLFNELPLLLNELISQGYSIVPVSTLMEHAEYKPTVNAN